MSGPTQELASARLLVGGGGGLRGAVKCDPKIDMRTLLMLCDNLLQVLEQSGYMTPNIATARPLIKAQLEEWGYAATLKAQTNGGPATN